MHAWANDLFRGLGRLGSISVWLILEVWWVPNNKTTWIFVTHDGCTVGVSAVASLLHPISPAISHKNFRIE